jgi:hypothetical protein
LGLFLHCQKSQIISVILYIIMSYIHFWRFENWVRLAYLSSI